MVGVTALALIATHPGVPDGTPAIVLGIAAKHVDGTLVPT